MKLPKLRTRSKVHWKPQDDTVTVSLVAQAAEAAEISGIGGAAAARGLEVAAKHLTPRNEALCGPQLSARGELSPVLSDSIKMFSQTEHRLPAVPVSPCRVSALEAPAHATALGSTPRNSQDAMSVVDDAKTAGQLQNEKDIHGSSVDCAGPSASLEVVRCGVGLPSPVGHADSPITFTSAHSRIQQVGDLSLSNTCCTNEGIREITPFAKQGSGVSHSGFIVPVQQQALSHSSVRIS